MNYSHAANENIDDLQFDEQDRMELRYEFAKLHKGYYEEISQAYEMGDTELVRRLAHTLKSSAALIHESKLSELSKEIEQKLRNGVMPEIDFLASFRDEFIKVMADIGEKTLIPVKAEELLGEDEARRLLDMTEPMLKAKKVESIDMLEGLRKIFGSEDLCERLEYYEFDEALSELKKLRESLAQQ